MAQELHRLMQYALLLAAQGDEYPEQLLGPIHLLKYAYLADMDYAIFNEGRIYSGVTWKFHHFGPWSAEAFMQIDEALAPIGAIKKTFQSDYGDKDCIRWKAEFDGTLLSDLSRELPIEVKQSLQKNVRRFQNDTTLLLHYVYATPPMLNAAPEETLDFKVMVASRLEKQFEYIPFLVRISKDNRKKLKQGMDELRKRFQKNATQPYRDVENILGREDAIYDSGVHWLDSLAGIAFPQTNVTVRFSDDVWKSKARSGIG